MICDTLALFMTPEEREFYRVIEKQADDRRQKTIAHNNDKELGMNVGQLLQKIKDLIAAFRAGDHLAAALIAWDILQAFLNSIPKTELGKPRAMHASYSAGFDLESASIDQCVDELETCCNSSAVQGMDKVAGGGALIAILGPIIVKLVLKWLGM